MFNNHLPMALLHETVSDLLNNHSTLSKQSRYFFGIHRFRGGYHAFKYFALKPKNTDIKS